MRGRILLFSFLCAVVIVATIFALWRREPAQPNVADNPKPPPVEHTDPPPPVVPDEPAPKTISRDEAIAALEQAGVVLVRDQDQVTSADFSANQESDLLRYLPAFEELRGLKIRRMTIGKNHLAPLLELKQLQVLDLQICWLADDSIETLSQHPSLSIVMFKHVNVHDDDLITLSRLSKLDSLLLTDAQITLDGMGQFYIARPKVLLRADPMPDSEKNFAEKFEKLGGQVQILFGKVVSIDLTGTAVTDDDLRVIGLLPHVKSLQLRNTNITDKGIEHLKTLTKLDTLYVHGSKVTEKALSDLRKQLPLLRTASGGLDDSHSSTSPFDNPDFRVLVPPSRELTEDEHFKHARRLVGSYLKTDDIERLLHVDKLSSLYLIDCTVGNDVIPALGRLPYLKSLYVFRGELSLRVMVSLIDSDWLDRINTLYLVDVNLSTDELKDLRWFQGLRKLTLVGEQVTDEVVTELTYLPVLCELSLVRTSLTDESVPELSQLSLLQSLYLTQTKISAAGIETLEQALPDCTIYR